MGEWVVVVVGKGGISWFSCGGTTIIVVALLQFKNVTVVTLVAVTWMVVEYFI